MPKAWRNRIIGGAVVLYAATALYLSTTAIWHSWVQVAFLAVAPLAAGLLISTGKKPHA
jgi:hypothetical protein